MADTRISRLDERVSGSTLTERQLREYWYADLNKVNPGLGDRYRNNDVNFPRSRKDLLAHYEARAIAEFKLESE